MAVEQHPQFALPCQHRTPERGRSGEGDRPVDPFEGGGLAFVAQFGDGEQHMELDDAARMLVRQRRHVPPRREAAVEPAQRSVSERPASDGDGVFERAPDRAARRPCRSIVSTTPSATATELGRPDGGGAMLGAMLGGRHVAIPMSIRVHCSSSHERGVSVEVSASVRCAQAGHLTAEAVRDRSCQVLPDVGVRRSARVRAPAHRCGAVRIAGGGIHHSEDRVRLAACPLGRPGHDCDLVEAASRGFVTTSGEQRFALAHQDVRAERVPRPLGHRRAA